MKKNFLVIALALGAMVFTSCKKDGVENGNQTKSQPAYVNISLVDREVPQVRSLTGDTEVGTAAENKISVLEFYVFDATGNTPDVEVGRVDENTPGTGYIKILATETQLQHKIRVSAGAGKKFVVVANMNLGDITPAMNTYDAVRSALSKAEFVATATDNNTRTIPTDGFEMSGVATADVVAESSTNQVYITISRLVSKVNAPTIPTDITVELGTQAAINEVWAGNVVTPADEITFEYVGYAVINGLSKSNVLFTGNATGNYIAPVTAPWNTWSTTGKTHLLSSFDDVTGLYTNNYSGKVGSTWFLDGSVANNADRVYVYENKPADTTLNGIVGFASKTVTAYVIHGKLKTAGQPDVDRYWRVDLIKSDNYHIMRNVVYKVTISKISTPGFGTPKEAEEQPITPGKDQTMANFVIKIANWDINTENTQM